MSDNSLFILIFTGTWCLVGLVFLAVAIGLKRTFQRKEERLRARTDGTVAEVVRRVSHSSNGSGVSWYPIVEFEVDGRRISLECAEGGGRKRFYEGQRVEVLYDPDDPSCFRLEGHSATKLLGNVFLAIGLGCVAVGAIAAVCVGLLSNKIHIQ